MAVQVTVNHESGLPGLDAERSDRIVERAVQAVFEDRGAPGGEVSVTLIDDDGMAGLNREWKGRDAPTDVLAFALYDEGESPVGDVYIGVDRAAEQGAAAGEPPERELARLVIHGALHVLGLDHPETDRESSEMWQHQERILTGLDLS
jgi:probable rRNA maturation factor